MSFSTRSLLVIAAIAAASSFSFATPLPLGSDVAPSISAPVAGSPLFSTGVLPYVTSSAKITGTYSGSVYQESLADNPLGGLTFVYTITEDGTSTDTLEHAVVSNYAGFLADVSDSGPTAPSDVNRKATNGGDDISFNFTAVNLPVGGSTSELILRTNAPLFTINSLSLIDNSTATVNAVGPSPSGGSSPEPASLGLLSIGAVAFLRRRRA